LVSRREVVKTDESKNHGRERMKNEKLKGESNGH
jgi:hypothetical protein